MCLIYHIHFPFYFSPLCKLSYFIFFLVHVSTMSHPIHLRTCSHICGLFIGQSDHYNLAFCLTSLMLGPCNVHGDHSYWHQEKQLLNLTVTVKCERTQYTDKVFLGTVLSRKTGTSDFGSASHDNWYRRWPSHIRYMTAWRFLLSLF